MSSLPDLLRSVTSLKLESFLPAVKLFFEVVRLDELFDSLVFVKPMDTIPDEDVVHLLIVDLPVVDGFDSSDGLSVLGLILRLRLTPPAGLQR